VWIWPPSRPEFYARLASVGAFTVTERVNTCMGMFRRKVNEAYKNLGWNNPNAWQPDDEDTRSESDIALRSDAVFAPNRFVRESLLEIGCPESRILDSSYGWSPERMTASAHPAFVRGSRLRFLFVGTGSVRKGLPLLLRAWKDAAIDAELVIAGTIDREVREGCRELLALPSVVQTGHVLRIADVYRSADVFVFPTHEEGGPQVTFEAAGCGLALLVSEMGAAGAFRNQMDALIINPFDHDGWVENIRQVSRDSTILSRLQGAASARAQDFTWARVARRRLAQLSKMTGGPV
jgi:glycosyltransferase involved in cell wall biosynthesis